MKTVFSTGPGFYAANTNKVDDMIPPAHYEAVAKVIGFILSAARRRRAPALP